MVNRSDAKQSASVNDYSPAAMTVTWAELRIAAAQEPNQPGAGGC